MICVSVWSVLYGRSNNNKKGPHYDKGFLCQYSLRIIHYIGLLIFLQIGLATLFAF